MRGRKPTPSDLNDMRGNPGRRKRNDAEPKPPRTAPKCPPHVAADKEAKAEWGRMVKLIGDMRMLTADLRAALAAYCLVWSRWVAAETFVRKMGAVLYKKDADGGLILESGYQNPQLFVANKALEQMTKLLAEFGLTPSSRTRVAAPKDVEETDPFEVLLNGHGNSN